MKKLAIAIVALVGLAASVQAADVPRNLLGKMGLGGMQQLSDAQGMTIRGMGNRMWLNQDFNSGIIVNQNTQNTGNIGDIENESSGNETNVEDSFNDNEESFNKKVIKKGRRGRRNGNGGAPA